MSERLGDVQNFCSNPPLPKALNIEINNSCNQKCIFCPYHGKYAVKEPKTAVISFDKVKQLLEQAKALGIGEKEIGFYIAGEAFLHKELINIISFTKQIGFKYTFLTTNGALATPDKMKAILDAGLDSIRFSINASNREMYKMIHGKDDFEKVVENLKYMNNYIKKNNLNVATSLSCVLTKKTMHIENEIKNMFGQYVDDIMFIPVYLGRLKKNEVFIQEFQLLDDSKATINSDFICPLLFNTMYINANLEVMPCCEAYDSNSIFYDLKKDFNLVNAWNSDKYRQYRDIFLNGRDDSDTICQRCILRMQGTERLMK